MLVGLVKWYDCRKGYGFIVAESGEDVLAHYSVIEGTGFRRLFDGEAVAYEAARGPKGLNATLVRRLNPERRPIDGKKSPLILPAPAPSDHPPAGPAESP